MAIWPLWLRWLWWRSGRMSSISTGRSMRLRYGLGWCSHGHVASSNSSRPLSSSSAPSPTRSPSAVTWPPLSNTTSDNWSPTSHHLPPWARTPSSCCATCSSIRFTHFRTVWITSSGTIRTRRSTNSNWRKVMRLSWGIMIGRVFRWRSTWEILRTRLCYWGISWRPYYSSR